MRLLVILQVLTLLADGRVIDFERDVGGVPDDITEETAWYHSCQMAIPSRPTFKNHKVAPQADVNKQKYCVRNSMQRIAVIAKVDQFDNQIKDEDD